MLEFKDVGEKFGFEFLFFFSKVKVDIRLRMCDKLASSLHITHVYIELTNGPSLTFISNYII